MLTDKRDRFGAKIFMALDMTQSQPRQDSTFFGGSDNSLAMGKTAAGKLLSGSLSLLLLGSSLAIMLPPTAALAGPDICATPGKDGPVNATDIVNSYFPPQANTSLVSGTNSLTLDSYYTEGANVPISAGDMLMIIQMQDAEINSTNTAAYGSGDAANDGKGITALNNTGVYEFVRASNDVPLSGGTLNFVGGAANDGVINTYVNEAATATRGRRTFQVIRMVQYASLTLTQDITVPDWNGQVGGVLGLDIAGDMDFNGFTIDGTERGFRGGFIPNDTSSGANNGIYVAPTTSTEVGGKGEGIAGTPHYTWDGTAAVDLGSEQLPGGDGGRGAPGNAGGGGNAHNAGGGGGSNGGEGGFGGIGWQSDQNGPLFSRGIGGAIPIANPVGDRLIMGGGGGGGDVNNDTNGIRGGQGGGIIMIRADRFVGTGRIISNGSDGEQGEFTSAPDGAGGGGAGGTVALVAKSGDLSGVTVEARGGDGGDTVRDLNDEHGPGGGGGGGVVVSTSPNGPLPAANADLAGGTSGLAAAGSGSPHGSTDGEEGIEGTLNPAAVPPVQQGANCFPQLNVTKTEANPGPAGDRTAPNTASYTITATNTGAGGASAVRLSDELPAGFSYSSGATASFSGGATGPTSPTNTGSASVPVFGDYTIPEGGEVSITFTANISAGTAAGTYQNPAYATYADPSRETSTRRVSPSNGAMTGSETSYESGSQATLAIPGSNYISTSSPNEDVVISASIPSNGLPNSSPPPPTSLSCHDAVFGDFVPNGAPFETIAGGRGKYSTDTEWTAIASDGTTATLRTVAVNNISGKLVATGADPDVFFLDFTDTRTGFSTPKLVEREGEPGDNWVLEIEYNRPIGSARTLIGDIDSAFNDSGATQFKDIISVEGFLDATSVDATNTYFGSILVESVSGNVHTFSDNPASPSNPPNGFGPNPPDSDNRNRIVVDHENTFTDRMQITYTVGAPLTGLATQSVFMTSGMAAGCRIGGNAFFDTNEDDLLNNSEPGFGSVTVTLYKDDGDGVLETNGEDLLIETRETEVDGDYLFTNLAENETYWVDIDTFDPDLGGNSYAGGDVVASETDPRDVGLTLSDVFGVNFPFGDRANGMFSLVKRITAVNRGLANEQLFDTTYVNVGNNNDEDNLVNWPGSPQSATIGSGTVESYLPGITNGAASSVMVQPNDQIEYTIPFLSHGGGAAQDVFICDRIPTHTTFISNAFNDVTPTGPGRGIFLSFNGQDVSLTNADDGDEIAATGGNNNGIGGYYFSAGIDPSAALGATVDCGGSNDNGAIVVDLNDVPNSTGDGVPADSYGFIRFRTVVD